MRDSLFSGRNHYDPQVASADRLSCQLLMEATVRRLVRVSGPVDAASVAYRLADICAGANVVPLDLLREEKPKEAAAPAPVPPPARKNSLIDRVMDRMNRLPLVWFYVGLFCGWLVFGR